MKNRILILFIPVIGISNAQEKYSKLIVGMWEFDKTCDLRTESEKNQFEEIPWCPPMTESGTGYPNRTFKNNGEYIDYFTSEHIEYGKWRIKNNKLILTNRISEQNAESRKELIKKLLKKGLVSKGEDGFYYQKPIEMEIKYLTNNRLEFGDEKIYSIHKRKK
ncbi:hypothetical protein N9W61_00500 [Algibacter sp.]|nr:hypothetical protein [Algibacter sp.]